MSLRIRRLAEGASLPAITAALATLAVAAAPAGAYVTSDLINWNLTTTAVDFPTQYHISSGTDGAVSYRWLDSPNQDTDIWAKSCTDNSSFSSTHYYPTGSTSYQTLFFGASGLCFKLRGRTLSGSLTNHDGRVQR